MRELNLIAQTSLDGFVAGPRGEFDNFMGGEENLEFVCSIVEEADAAMFGRISYELINAAWPGAANRPGATKNEIKYSNWYNSVTKVVFSKTLQAGSSTNTYVVSENPLKEINRLKGKVGKNILMFGSPTVVHELLELNAIDNMWMIVHPVLFGDGIPLFRKTNRVTSLSLLTTHRLSNGTLCNKYKVEKSG